MKISIEDAAREKTEVYFFLGHEAATANTLFGELGYFYRARFCTKNWTEWIGFYEYPYARDPSGIWSMVGIPNIDLHKLELFTTFEECLEAHNEKEAA